MMEHGKPDGPPFVEVAAGGPEGDVGGKSLAAPGVSPTAQPGVIQTFEQGDVQHAPSNESVKAAGNPGGYVSEFMNKAIDFLMVTGRWEKMAEPVRSVGRYIRQAATLGFERRLSATGL